MRTFLYENSKRLNCIRSHGRTIIIYVSEQKIKDAENRTKFVTV